MKPSICRYEPKPLYWQHRVYRLNEKSPVACWKQIAKLGSKGLEEQFYIACIAMLAMWRQSRALGGSLKTSTAVQFYCILVVRKVLNAHVCGTQVPGPLLSGH